MRYAFILLALTACKFEEPDTICVEYTTQSGFRPGVGFDLLGMNGGGYTVGAMTWQTWQECVRYEPNPRKGGGRG